MPACLAIFPALFILGTSVGYYLAFLNSENGATIAAALLPEIFAPSRGEMLVCCALQGPVQLSFCGAGTRVTRHCGQKMLLALRTYVRKTPLVPLMFR
jgi:hypothetical protein